MKVKTSVTLSEDVLQRLQEQLGPGGNRSEFIEEAVRQRLRDIRRAERDARDRAIYERMAADAQIQAEVLDNLELAVPWWELGDEVEVSDEVRKRWESEGRLRATGRALPCRSSAARPPSGAHFHCCEPPTVS